jgi:hypothetical protein
MAATLTAYEALNRGASILSLAKNCLSLASNMKAFVGAMNIITEAPPKELADFIVDMETLYSRNEDVINRMGNKGLAKNFLVSQSIQRLGKYNADLKDAIESFRLGLDPAVSEAIAKALEEYERGETVGIDSIL